MFLYRTHVYVLFSSVFYVVRLRDIRANHGLVLQSFLPTTSPLQWFDAGHPLAFGLLTS